jgi:hypothetical protein
MAQHRCGRSRWLALPATGDHGSGDRGIDEGRKGGAVMNTLHHTETAQIIQFSAFRPKLGKKTASSSEPISNLPRNEPATATGKNQRIRQQLHVNWRRADSIREYWRAWLKMSGAISRVQSHNLPEGDLHPRVQAAGPLDNTCEISRGDHATAAHARVNRRGSHMEARGIQSRRSSLYRHKAGEDRPSDC